MFEDGYRIVGHVLSDPVGKGIFAGFWQYLGLWFWCVCMGMEILARTCDFENHESFRIHNLSLFCKMNTPVRVILYWWSGQLPCTGKSGQRKPASHVHLLHRQCQCPLLVRWFNVGEVHLPPPPVSDKSVHIAHVKIWEVCIHLDFKHRNYITVIWKVRWAWCNAYSCKNFVGRTLGTSGPD